MGDELGREKEQETYQGKGRNSKRIRKREGMGDVPARGKEWER